MEIIRQMPLQTLLGLIREPCGYAGGAAGSSTIINAVLPTGLMHIQPAGFIIPGSDLLGWSLLIEIVLKNEGELDLEVVDVKITGQMAQDL